MTGPATPTALTAVPIEAVALSVREVGVPGGPCAGIRRLSLDIPEGAFVVVSGAADSGAAALFGVLSGRLVAAGGELFIRGRPASSMSRSEILRTKKLVGVMERERSLGSGTVHDALALPLREHTEIRGARLDGAIELALRRSHLAASGARLARDLAAGEQRRLALARALVLGPTILLCDEPLAGLDALDAQGVRDRLLAYWQTLGGTVVVFTETPESFQDVADFLVRLAGGGVLSAEPAGET